MNLPLSPSSSRLLVAGLLAGLVACATGEAEAQPPTNTHALHHPVPQGDLLSVGIETLDGRPLDTYWHQGAVYVAGHPGMAYRIRLTNLTGERLEAVVSVDGRDVVTGRLGDYRNQRGYVVPPYGTITIDGFRRSLDQVATFRFADVADAYTTRMGTPEHVGVIGVAVFRERVRHRRRRPRPLTTYDDRPAGAPYPESAAADRASAPAAEAPAESGVRARSARSARPGGAGGFAPAPRPRNRIGTAYGETRTSSVVETTFRRRHPRRPDRLITLYYDTPEGLAARGVYVAPPPPPVYSFEPDPWPRNTRFAPPPPPPRY
ncbi:MAG: hypothetical protein D6705_17035 [Deltaproteobacteria bacterium]|nr:MAG: hypothetical protein D6705_17035 [Deltaproteobacteria bacterium]